MHKKSVTAIVPLVGNYVQVQTAVTGLLSELCAAPVSSKVRIEFVFVGDGGHWGQVVDVAGFQRMASATLLEMPKQSLPAILFNKGATAAQGEYLAFLWPGVDVSDWYAGIERLADKVEEQDVLLAGSPSVSQFRADMPKSWLHDPTDGNHRDYPAGWVEMADFVPMSHCLVRREKFIEHGGFSTSVLLQRAFWWDFSLHLSRAGEIRGIQTSPQHAPVWNWHEYPLDHELQISADLYARSVMLGRSEALTQISTAPDINGIKAFAKLLPSHDAQRLVRSLNRFCPAIGVVPPQLEAFKDEVQPLRITVLGGPGEPAHNQLCFFNYFRQGRLSIPITWRSILDTAATSFDLYGSDLVIFSRAKSKHACALMDFCNRAGIATVYMLDDNWFTVGQDWPEYARVFNEESEIYKAFTYCLRKADTALTYNRLLADDMSTLASDVVVLPTNIDLDDFPSANRNKERRAVVGYAGSSRPDNAAFRALTELASQRDDFDVLYMGHAVPAALKNVPENRIRFEPYVYGYKAYANTLSKHAPDILLAPLGNTHFEASKCPNKFLEIAAVRAAGIFSKVEPYLSFIEEGKTGVFATETVESWKESIAKLLDDGELRTRIQDQARVQVTSGFATENVSHHFEKFLLYAAGKGRAKAKVGPRVALVSHSAHPAGAERALANFLGHMSDGVEAVAVFPLGDGPIRKQVEESGTVVFDADYSFNVPTRGDIDHVRFQEALNINQTQRFHNLFKELELDGVVVNTNVLPPAVHAAAMCELPVILHSHGLISPRLATQLDPKRWGVEDARQINVASAVVCPSPIAADAYSELYRVPPSKMEIVPNGTPCVSWTSLRDMGHIKTKFSMLCTLEPNKNVPMFIEAAKIYVGAGGPPCEFHIYGAGAENYVSQLRDLVWASGLTNVFHFHPKVNDVDAVYDESRAVVVTSQLESFSFVTIEAMSRARPVISTRCGGPEGLIVDGETGYLIEKNNAAALAKLMTTLAENIDLASDLGTQARRRAESEFEIGKIAQRYSGFIKAVIERTPPQALLDTREIAMLGNGVRDSIAWPSDILSSTSYLPVIGRWRASLHPVRTVDPLLPTMRAMALQHANSVAALQRGLMQKARRRFVLHSDLWNLVDGAYSEIKDYCLEQGLNSGYKLVLGRNLADVPFVEYQVSLNRIKSLDLALELSIPDPNGVVGIEIVNEDGKITHQVARSLAGVNPYGPVRLDIHDGEHVRGHVRLRLFVMNCDAPVWIYELAKTRLAGLVRPSRLPFMKVYS